MKKVSVIVPIYNTGDYVLECLQSISQQTYGNIEIVVVNDCTLDHAMEIVAKHASNQPNIRIIDHHENLGLSAARNTGLLHATGSYIQFVDSDDYLPAKAIEALVMTAELDGADMVRGSFRVHQECDSGRYRIHNDHKLISLFKFPVHSVRGIEYPLCAKCGMAWQYLFKKEFLDNYEFFFHEELKRREGRPFLIRALLTAKSLSIITNPVCHYRIRAPHSKFKSIMQKFDYWDAEYLLRQIEILEEIIHEVTFTSEEAIYFFSALRYETLHKLVWLKKFAHKNLPKEKISVFLGRIKNITSCMKIEHLQENINLISTNNIMSNFQAIKHYQYLLNHQ